MNTTLKYVALLTLALTAVSLIGCQNQSQSQSKAAPAGQAEQGKTPSSKENSVAESGKNPVVVIETSAGTIKAELFADKAPLTVANFLRYTDEKFYDGTIYHRVIPGFMIQGGGFTPDMNQKPTHEPIKNEARADVPNARGTLAMARTSVVDSATGQFFINLVDNSFLNHRSKSPDGFGYAVFGRVIDGMDVVDKIAKVRTANRGPHGDVPVETVEIKSIRKAQ